MDKVKHINGKILGGSLIIVVIISLILWALSPVKTMLILNDKLFMVSIIAACMGSIVGIVSKSRRHYYLHLKSKFAGKTKDDILFNEEEDRRERHTQFGVSVALSGGIGLILCTLMIFL